MDYAKHRKYRHADPLKVRQVWETLNTVKAQRSAVPADKINKLLRKTLNLKDDQIRLLLDEIEGDGLIEKNEPAFGKSGLARYLVPDFTKSHQRGKHDWYCFQCHKPGEVLRCSDCFRVYHSDCAQDASTIHSPSYKTLRSPTLQDNENDFICPVCESRPKCEFSRKQIRKLLEFATHYLRKQPLWKMFVHIGYKSNIMKNEYLLYKYIDLELLQHKIKDGRYAALEEFSMDVQLLVHNVCILHGLYSTEADEIRVFLRSVNVELDEIQLCTDCYINAKARVTDWISKPCKPRHELIWARNRTAVGACLFNFTISISQFYWPAKILLERDNGYEIRFFGGTHERMFVKKIHTRPFHLPADEVGVLRRSTSTGNLSGGGFERAWNEVSKLQANIDSGYYTHSSGESDLPPSDDEYSDEIYLGPRRKVLNNHQRLHRADSPRSSLNSGNLKANKRRRHISSSSHQTTTNSATPLTDTPSPAPDTPPSIHFSGKQQTKARINSHIESTSSSEKRQIGNRILMPTVQPGTPGAAAISALAETKAAMAAAVGPGRRTSNAYTADLLALTHREDDKHVFAKTKENRKLSGTRGRRGRGRPPMSDGKNSALRRRIYPSSSLSPNSSDRESSSLSLDTRSESENVNDNDNRNWRSSPSSDWKLLKKVVEPSRRGRPSKIRGRVKTASWDGEDASNIWSKSNTSYMLKPSLSKSQSKLPNNSASIRFDKSNKKRSLVGNKNHDLHVLGGKKSKRYSKQSNDLDNSVHKHDEDDELTDRCVSPIANNNSRDSKRHSLNQWDHVRLGSKLHSSQTQQLATRKISSEIKTSPKKWVSNTKRHSSHSSNCSTYSSSDDDADDDNILHRQHSGIVRTEDDDRRLRSPTRTSTTKDQRVPGTSSTMLRRPPFAPPLNTNSTSGNNLDRNNLAATPNSFFSNSGQSFSPNSNDINNSMNSIVNSGLQSTNKQGGLLNISSNTGPTVSNLMTSIPVNTMSSNNLPTTTTMSTLPRSHLPPNKRATADAAAAATAAALNTSSGINDVSNDLGQQRQTTLRNADTFNTSPKKLLHKAIQTPVSMDTLSSTNSQLPCVQCKDWEAERLATANEATKALKDLEEKLATQFKEEKATSLHSALEQTQASARDAIEHERKLARDALEATEARFNEIIVQTKRRQWCRNCLSEAIYHCCWNTSYCSTQCQQEHWQKEHKRQCRRKR